MDRRINSICKADPLQSSKPIPVAPLSRLAIPADTVKLALYLLGKIVVRQGDGIRASGRIVETEAYVEGDPACYAYRSMTPRNRSLFLEPGHAYVYICHGTSHMLNVSSEREGVGTGVLIRALEPLEGLHMMQGMRMTADLHNVTRGPGRLTKALQIDRRHDGIDLFADGPVWIGSDGTIVESIGQSVRIGISQGAEARLRYFVFGSEYVSGPRQLNGVRISPQSSEE